MPGGVVNLVTGERETLAKTLADHDDVAAMWYFGDQAGSEKVERASSGNLKATWVDNGVARQWNSTAGHGREFLLHATQIKNIWVPYGE